MKNLSEALFMLHPASRSILSVDAYLASENGGECRHEYIDGQLYATTSASRAHGSIILNRVVPDFKLLILIYF